MTVVDPFASLNDWRSSLYRGKPAAVDLFLDTIDSTLPRDWVRDRGYEQTSLRPDRILCYLFARVGDVEARVWLQRVTASRVRGGPIQLIRHPSSGDTGRIGVLVAEFADVCVLPAAEAAGVGRTRPAFGLRSVVTHFAETLFTQFADTANGEWPLTDRTQGLWDELITGCLAEHVAIDRGELGRWLADSGWKPAAVTEIVERFYADSEWWARRLAVMAP